MNKATEILQQAKTFYIATMDGDQPRVRPFGAAVEFDGKTYICMNNTKKVFQQLLKNPKVEISGMVSGKWFRITGTLVRDDRNEARAEFLKLRPVQMYEADDGIFEVFYFSEVSGTIESFNEPKETF
ncbi:pyridoxamine 5'-phosphate oxidase [Oxobacter pfennigii]|uniref:Pyridoxamine 5'-phosphate oxidase n=1 Tax=Oxobacter pfennigii TaxID=36849 RepID=A0A0P9ACT2_9CLOT|nr:pyridoxamine 5'-phosphate oxidase family protein [Oxobacter pfennigii]KPU42894.1 pyridoxamine 5'-phosphate oxidase [Oxobacter pfennigii]